MLQKPNLIIIAGPNGSGKTTITNQVLLHQWVEGCMYINPDEIAKKEFGDWNNYANTIKAAKLATQLRKKCLNNKQSFIFETVFSAYEKIDFVFDALKKGFFIRFFFISTDHPSINSSRVTKRYLEGGHDVPIPKIISRYYKSINNCEIIAPLVDRLYVYDNSIENENATLLFRAKKGVVQKRYKGSINDWASGILDNLL